MYFKKFKTSLVLLLIGTAALSQPTTYRFDVISNECKKLVTPEGSVIFVETDAFATLSDIVKISYTEYRSTTDMLLNDIRMHTPLGTDKLQLESSGMFEISASADGIPVTLKKGKRIAVQMALDEKPDWPTQAYKYDSANQNWVMYKSEVTNIDIAKDEDLWGSPRVDLSQPPEFNDDWAGGFDNGFGMEVETEEEKQRKKVFQMMEIDQLGLYNYDRILDGVQYEYMEPIFVDSNDQPINSTIYIVYQGINSVFYFPLYTWESSFFTIVGVEYQLFTILNGEVLVAQNKPIKTEKGIKYMLQKAKPNTDLRSTLTDLLAKS